MGQLCFAAEARRRLGRKWHLVLIAGRDSIARDAADYIRDALKDATKAEEKWSIPEEALVEIKEKSETALAAELQVMGWESLLKRTSEAIRTSLPESWTREQALAKLRYFHMKRAEAGLFSPPSVNPGETLGAQNFSTEPCISA